MNRFLPILALAALAPVSAPAVEWGLPWFHTRPKPVLLDDQSSGKVSQKTVKRTEFRPVRADSSQRRDPNEKKSSAGAKTGLKTAFK